jgi:hypothetical protein
MLSNLCEEFSTMKISNSNSESDINLNSVIKIQSWFRGCRWRMYMMPLIMYKIKKFLKHQNIKFSTENKDGRINSCVDEDHIIELLISQFKDRIKVPKMRMWYDILAYDYRSDVFHH